DPATTVVQLDSNPSGVNNSTKLTDAAGNVTISASGDSRFGSNPGEVYNSLAIVYRDASDRLQYAAAPMNGSSAGISGNHYDYGFLTDAVGTIPGNTGSTTVIERNDASVQVGGGTIFAGSLTPVQTGVAEIGPSNALIFDTPPIPQLYTVSVTGSAFYAPGKEYGSVVIQYRDATDGITYDSLAIGSSHDFFGYRFRVFITDTVGQTGDNSGSLAVSFTPAVPEPSALTAILGLLLLKRRSR
ncbi:MAG TPA: hypothetical protein VH518_01875, partial [Tepidisphaeraceae bacterium]